MQIKNLILKYEAIRDHTRDETLPWAEKSKARQDLAQMYKTQLICFDMIIEDLKDTLNERSN